MPDEKDKPDRNGTDEKGHWRFINREWAATFIFSGIVLLLVAFLLNRFTAVVDALSYVLDIFRPILIGLIIAFILYKPTARVENFLRRFQKRYPRLPVVGLSVLASYLLLLGLLALVIWIIVPAFVTSIRDFAGNLMDYYNRFISFLNSNRGDQLQQILNDIGFQPSELRSRLLNLTSQIPTYLGAAGNWISGFIGSLVDVFIGLFFSVYVLAGRHRLKSQTKRLLQHFLPPRHYRRLSHYGSLTFDTFSNFISGQLADAFILGLLIFIIMFIGRLEYPAMIAVILGVTNVIPYVGPWVGTVPCALILLAANPLHAVAFVIIVIAAQQFDSNFIYPRVVGYSVGLPAIWVLFAITVGGGLFGILGMVAGVPLVAVLYAIIKEKTGETPKTREKKPSRLLPQLKKLLEKLRHRNKA